MKKIINCLRCLNCGKTVHDPMIEKRTDYHCSCIFPDLMLFIPHQDLRDDVKPECSAELL